MIVFKCRRCGKEFKVPDEAAGRIGKCADCGERCIVPGAIVARVAAVSTQPPPVPPPPVVSPSQVSHFSQPQPTVAIQINQPSSAAHSLGIASLVLGVLAFMVCWIPLLGLVGVPVAVVGLLLGLVGLILALVRKGRGLGFSIAGSFLSVFSLIIAVGIATAITSAVNKVGESLDSARTARDATNQQIAKAAPDDNEQTSQESALATKADTQFKATPEPAPTSRKQSPKDAPPAVESADAEAEAPLSPETPSAAEPAKAVTPVPNKWTNARDAIRLGDVRVKVSEVKVETIALGSFTGKGESKEKLLAIRLKIENLSDVRKLDFRGFSAERLFDRKNQPQLSDNFGNKYRLVDFGFSNVPVGQVHSESVYPGQFIGDLLVFEVPVEKIEYLHLELPADVFGAEGKLKFEITREMIQR